MTFQVHAQPHARPQNKEHTTSFGQGVSWLVQGWQLMLNAPFKLFGFALLPMIAAGIVQMLPHALAIPTSKWLATMVMAGMWPLLSKLDSDKQFSMKAIFRAHGWGRMAILALLMLMVFAMQCAFAVMLIGPDALNLLLFGQMIPVTQVELGLIFASGIPFILLMYFAPAEVLLNSSGVYSAIKTSLSLVLSAWKPISVLLIVNTLVTFLTPFTFLLSVVLLGPWLMCSGYQAYRDLAFNHAGRV